MNAPDTLEEMRRLAVLFESRATIAETRGEQLRMQINAQAAAELRQLIERLER